MASALPSIALLALVIAGNLAGNLVAASAEESKSLAEARAALALAASKEFRPRLEALAARLEAPDAALLLEDSAASVAEATARSAILVEAGELRILLGDFARAAGNFEAAAGPEGERRDEALLLRAARSWLAAGESDRAGKLAALVLSSAKDPSTVDRASLVAAWSALLGGNPVAARALAAVIVPKDPSVAGAALRREAAFLVWYASEGGDRSAAAAALASGFPGSPEALMAAGSPTVLLRALPHWYFGAALPGAPPASGVAGEDDPTAAAAPAKELSPAAPAATATTAEGEALPRYQLGIFSRPDHAKALVAELGKKGFAARIENRRVSGQDLVAVIVDAADQAAPSAKAGTALFRSGLGESLKNAGYEAWPLYD